MKKAIHIFFLSLLFTLSLAVQTEYLINHSDTVETSQVVQEGSESTFPKDRIYDPIIPYSGVISLHLTNIVPEPVVSEKFMDVLSGKDSHETWTAGNNTSLLFTSNHLVRSLSVKKLIFPFHSFL